VRDRPRQTLLSQAVPPRPRLARHQPQEPHQRPDERGGTRLTPPQQRGVHPPISVGLIGVGERLLDQQHQIVTSCRGRRHRPAQPFIETGRRHLQPLTHPDDPILRHALSVTGCLLHIDELIPSTHRYSWAKKAAAFPRNSLFKRSSRTSASSSRNLARSDNVNGGSSPAWARRYAFTQFRSVCSFTPISRATVATGLDSWITIFAASSLYSGENDLRFAVTITSFASDQQP